MRVTRQVIVYVELDLVVDLALPLFKLGGIILVIQILLRGNDPASNRSTFPVEIGVVDRYLILDKDHNTIMHQQGSTITVASNTIRQQHNVVH